MGLSDLPTEILEHIIILANDPALIVALRSTNCALFHKLTPCEKLWKYLCHDIDQTLCQDWINGWYGAFQNYVDLHLKIKKKQSVGR